MPKNELIERRIVDFSGEDKWLHKDTAPYIHTHNIRDDTFAQIPSKADDASGTSMYIRHNADFTLAEHRYGQQGLDLFNGRFLYMVRKYPDIVIFYRSHSYNYMDYYFTLLLQR